MMTTRIYRLVSQANDYLVQPSNIFLSTMHMTKLIFLLGTERDRVQRTHFTSDIK